ncbi:hypothetical protein CPY53_24090 [Paenibacillus polymyxa]|uniref:DUF5677 domain-containing protein n=1 Tax=Paenibacillus polymyxa TaxID=1406 RepID=UPI001F5AE155|nr:DUF5677 domain-containing protein [Paenibacillus polymyxa]UNL96442.1 hypothetical protein CPY53_24090 [Paenibacillus polymyxa]
MTDANKLIVKRRIENKELRDFFHNSGIMFDDIVDYGSNLLEKCQVNFKFNEFHAPFQTMFIQFLSLIDGLSILIKQGHGDAIKPVLRSILELYLNLQFMINNDFEDSCVAYQVIDAHERIKAYKKFSDTSKLGEEYRQIFKNVNLSVDSIKTEAPILNLEALLKRGKYKDMNERYEELKKQRKKQKRKMGLKWYSVINQDIEGIRDLAKSLNRELYYEIFYKNFSNYSHGGNSLKRISVTHNNEAVLPHIRHYDDIPSNSNIAVDLAVTLFENMLKLFNKEELLKFWEWYNKKIAKPYKLLSYAEVKTDYQGK